MPSFYRKTPSQATNPTNRQRSCPRWSSVSSMILKQFQSWIVTDTTPFGKKIPPVVKYGLKSWPVTDVTATLEVGETRQETSAGRVVGGAILLGPLGAVAGAVAKKDTTRGRLVLDVAGERHALTFKGEGHADTAREWMETLDALAGRTPATSTPPPPPSSPAAWAPDPAGKHELRWWDGSAWTEHISDHGQPGTDPI